MKQLLLYLLIVNAAIFLIMLADKHCARKKRRRVPESVLLGGTIIGGSIGCLLGMYAAHHKTRKPLFFIGVPLIIVLQIILTYLFLK